MHLYNTALTFGQKYISNILFFFHQIKNVLSLFTFFRFYKSYGDKVLHLSVSSPLKILLPETENI